MSSLRRANDIIKGGYEVKYNYYYSMMYYYNIENQMQFPQLYTYRIMPPSLNKDMEYFAKHQHQANLICIPYEGAEEPPKTLNPAL